MFRRYASLYFVAVIDEEESELAVFDLIHVKEKSYNFYAR